MQEEHLTGTQAILRKRMEHRRGQDEVDAHNYDVRRVMLGADTAAMYAVYMIQGIGRRRAKQDAIDVVGIPTAFNGPWHVNVLDAIAEAGAQLARAYDLAKYRNERAEPLYQFPTEEGHPGEDETDPDVDTADGADGNTPL